GLAVSLFTRLTTGLLPRLVGTSLHASLLRRTAYCLARSLRVRTRLRNATRPLLRALLTKALLQPLHVLGKPLRASRHLLRPRVAPLGIVATPRELPGQLALLLGEFLCLVAQRLHGSFNRRAAQHLCTSFQLLPYLLLAFCQVR